MKQKTSITLSPEVLRAVDDLVGAGSNRSRIIEEALVEYIDRHRKLDRERRDLHILNSAAADLNAEVEEVLEFQAEL